MTNANQNSTKTETEAQAHQRLVRRVADLASALLAETPVPLEDEQAVALARALVLKGWKRGRR